MRRSVDTSGAPSSVGPVVAEEREILNDKAFLRMIAVERKRTERSGRPFLLMTLEAGNHQSPEKNSRVLDSIAPGLLSSTRETDVIGWYEARAKLAVIFTGLMIDDKNAILSTILTRLSTTLRDTLTLEQFKQISVSFHFFPDDWDHDGPGRPSDTALYPDLSGREVNQRTLLGIKRIMDIFGGALALVVCAPLFLIAALAIKATSEGPVLFRQQRVGQYGRCFTFLKLRSMRVDNDPSVHQEYVLKLINGDANCESSSGENQGIYKIKNDHRVTRVGRLLRRTSLDEIPQLFNVLKGEMSLVGPRPAIPYEVAAYQTWHRRRVLDVKPGITGSWQVNGRSRVKFDDMVRLDLQYAKSWSPWRDISILLRTPAAVLRGNGAY
jgi:lipopolysaccharide/colanic/teichoic acid biosynthesis glycosyltransferase